MPLALFAQANNAAFQAGQVFGIIIAVIVSASIPISFGASRGQPVIGAIGAVFSGGAAVLLGCVGGLPVAGLFCLIILMVSNSGGTKRKKRKKKPRREEYDDEDEDDYDRPRSRRAARDDEDDYDDRPRRSRRDDYDDEDDDRPRRRRRDDDY
ncbi:hypothetical protein J0H58_33455 [bacterium]|nr:hypothetical protein [bacterium]